MSGIYWIFRLRCQTVQIWTGLLIPLALRIFAHVPLQWLPRRSETLAWECGMYLEDFPIREWEQQILQQLLCLRRFHLWKGWMNGKIHNRKNTIFPILTYSCNIGMQLAKDWKAFSVCKNICDLTLWIRDNIGKSSHNELKKYEKTTKAQTTWKLQISLKLT